MNNNRFSPIHEQLARLESYTPFLLGAHGTLMLISLGGTPWAWALVGLTLTLGITGCTGRQNPINTTEFRAVSLALISTILLYLTGGVNSYFLLWYFVIVAIYPIVLPRRLGLLVPFILAMSYLLLFPFSTTGKMIPLVVVGARSFLILFIGVITHKLGMVFTEYSAERDMLIQQASDGIFISDLEGNYIDVNESGCRMLGYTHDEILRLNIRDLAPPALNPDPLRLEELKAGKILLVERNLRHKDGHTLSVEVSAKMIGGKKLEGIVRDISERKRLELLLREQQQIITTIADTAPVIIYVYDLETQTNVYSNNGIERILGYLPAEILAMGTDIFARLVHPDDLPAVITFQSQVLQARDEDTLEFEYRMQHGDGHWVHLHSYERPFLRNLDGTLKQKIGIAVDVTERVDNEEKLRQSEAKFRAIVESSPIGIFLMAPDGNVTYGNPADLRMTGLSWDDTMGTKWIKAIHPEDREQVMNDWKTAMAAGRNYQGRGRYLHEDGTIVWWEVSTAPVYDQEKLLGHVGMVVDITDKKRSEAALRESHEQFSTAFHASPVGFTITRIRDGLIVDINDSFALLSGFTREEVCGHSSIELEMLTVESRQHLLAVLHEKGIIRNVEVPFKTKTGMDRQLLISSETITLHGEPHYITCVIDITEWKLSEAALQESSKWLELAIQSSNIGLWDWDLQTNRVSYSREWKSQLGYADHEIGTEFSEWESRVHPEDLPGTLTQIHLFLAQPDKAIRAEFRMRHKNGTYRWIYAQCNVHRDSNANVVRVLGCHIDITERKEVEQDREQLLILERTARNEAEQSRAQVVNILESISDGFIALDKNWRFTYVNKQAGKITRRQPEDLLGKYIWDEFPEAIGSRFQLTYERAMREQQFMFIEDYYPPLESWIEVRIYPVKDGLSLFFHDITERKLAEQASIEKEQLLSESQRIAHIGGWSWELATDAITWTEETYRIHGLSPDSSAIDLEASFNLIHPDDLPIITGWKDACVKGDKPKDIEFRIIQPGGEIRLLSGQGDLVCDRENHPLRMVGTVRDITERKQAELERVHLLEKEQAARVDAEQTRAQLVRLLESVTDAFVALDKEWRYTYVNARAGEIFQRQPEDLIGKQIWTEFPEGVGQPFQRAYETAMAERKFVFLEDYYPPWDRWFENHIYPSENGITIFFHEITQRKKAEIALSASEERLRTIIATEPECVKILNADGCVQEMNLAGLRMVEADSFQKVKNQCVYPLVVEEDRQAFIELTAKVFSGESDTLEFQIVSLKGNHRWLETHASPLRDTTGQIIALIGITRDITESKRAEITLKENAERLRFTIKASNIGMWDWNLETNLVSYSREWKSQLGYEEHEISNEFSEWQSRVHPDDLPNAQEKIRDYLARKRGTFEAEFRMRHKDHSYRWIYARGEVIRDANNKAIRMMGCHLDITVRKQEESELIRIKQSLEQAEHRAKLGSWEFDTLQQTGWWSNEMYTLFQRDPARGTPAFNEFIELIHPEDRQSVIDTHVKMQQTGQGSRIEYRGNPEKELSRHFISMVEVQIRDGVTFLLGTTQDITERKQAEVKLIESEKKFRTLTEFSPMGIFLDDTQGNAIYINERCAQIVGIPAEAALGLDWVPIIHPDDRKRVTDQWVNTVNNGASFSEDYRWVHPDGSIVWTHGEIVPVRDEQGVVTEFIGTLIDITATKRRESELNAIYFAGQRLQALYSPEELANQLIHIIRDLFAFEFSEILLVDEELNMLIPFTYSDRDQITAKGISKPDSMALHKIKIGTGITGWVAQQGVSVRLGDVQKDKRYIPIRENIRSVLCVPLKIEKRTIGVINVEAIQMDAYGESDQRVLETIAAQISIAIHNVRLLEEIRNHATTLELRVAERTNQLSTANQELEAFSYSVSHDLRAPLRAISGFAEIIARRHRPSLNDEGQHYFDYIVQASERMEQLIGDLLKYSRLGRTAIHRQPVALADVLGEITRDLQIRLDELHGSVNIIAGLPVVTGDRTLLSQIFTNLLENAVTYCQANLPPSIEITYKTEKHEVIVQIRDNGIGIPIEHHKKIFNVFQRLHSIEQYPGTGIGLATVKKAVELLGGRVWVESKVGEGSVFFIQLPME